ncbi:snare region anchored in the vesicle membrane carboxy-terminal protein (macronuclear) [Tetrahymena thermophila SB210]|uniref:Snare region anchored in the vesicle membrane carboxy-terminal protein n=1 Tax=Tetrahymena thermophila (strain SB210) TaxID=312017 RepID=W7X969_TETTS|nr:snare region anchored in the vesicle membrane carboxy-terminal protein [Tetrahymena thermophila SB210]EWS72928.1 snare region anchored in the vesicle membrane carboxy-terminal protein [Tetrahymena thermophila SB210]|eukprot:XP_012654542.1 snare region anchored in the vesicle membrane carboxy-terminal protein [Tetrahymena thermophila SB210]
MSSSFDDDTESNNNIREQFIGIGDQKMKQNNQLLDMNARIENVNQIGYQVNADLKQQGDKLQVINRRVKETNHEADKVDKITNKMRRRQFYMNCLLYFVAFALFISIIVVLGVKLSKKLN